MRKKPKPDAPKWKDGEGGWDRLEDPVELRRIAEACDGVLARMFRTVGLGPGGGQSDKLKRLALAAGITLRRGRPGPQGAKLPPLDALPTAADDSRALDDALGRNRILERQVEALQRRTRARICEWSGDVLKLGLVSDTHLGSLYENPQLLEAAYDMFVAEGVDDVLHTGDLTDGEKMYPGHEYEIAVHGCDAQRDHVVETYPRRDGLRTRFILGNHDHSFWKRAGVNIGEAIAGQRDDMEYLGSEQHDLVYGGVVVRLQHPRMGCAYAQSYRAQKIIEALPGGQKPNVLVLGHDHKAGLLAFYRNVYAVQCGTTQSQTPFMAGKHLAAMMGFWVLTIHINKDGMGRVQDEFFPHFEEAA